MKPNLPTEEEECIALVDYLNFKNLKFTHIPNSTYTPSFSVKNRNKKLGVSAGVPDYMIILPKIGLLFIEMKRQKMSKKSKEQVDWIDELNKLDGIQAAICYGFYEAKKIIDKLLLIASC